MSREELLRKTAEELRYEEASRRRFLYKDVEALIEFGYITHAVSFGPAVTVAFRSLLPKDYQSIRQRCSTDDQFLRWAVACSVVSVAGYEVPLSQASEGSYAIFKGWVEELPDSWITALSVYPLALKNRVSRALRLVEAFSYEPYSRNLWRMLGRPQHRASGSNQVFRNWVALNVAEDESRDNTRTWTHTQTLVGSMTSKGSKQIGKMLDRWDSDEKSFRQEVIEKAVNWVIQGDAPPEEPIKVKFQGKEIEVGAATQPRSLRELEDEMRKVMEGEMDLHDTMVENHHRRARERVKAMRIAKAKQRDEARLLREARAMDNPAALVGYTKEQLDRINPGVGKKRTQVMPENSNARRLFDRYVSPKIVAGVLGPDMKVVDATTQGDASVKPSLQERVSRRKPSLKK